MIRLIFFLMGIFLFDMLFAVPADAYIDPNTGGFFFQTIAPFVYAMLGAIVVFWKRIVIFFKGLFGNKKNQGNSDKS